MGNKANTIDKTRKDTKETSKKEQWKPSQRHRQHNDKTKTTSQTRERKTSQPHRQSHEQRSQRHRQTNASQATTIEHQGGTMKNKPKL